MKKLLSILLTLFMLVSSTAVVSAIVTVSIPVISVNAEENVPEEESAEEDGTEGGGLEISAPSVILMEATTGKVIYENNSEDKLPPASVTKIMTLLLIYDALEEGRITKEDEISVSEYAASMGGSQVFLEPGEVQTVDTMIKCISVASANDACVAMAEHLYGSEAEFVNQMNERAKELGMENTHFENSNGLDTDSHLTTAKDIALMSRELITKYPDIHNYSTIWMDNITHTTSKGTSEFGLTNTNKLIRQYEYATGLKTGSTSKAKYCVSATAKKDDVELIAVIMAAPDYKVRFEDATTLLNYGFAKVNLYHDDNDDELPLLEVSGGTEKTIPCKYVSSFTYVDTDGRDLGGITKEIKLEDKAKAPVKAGDTAGKAVYLLDGEEIGSVNVIYKESIGKAKFKDFLAKAGMLFCL